jgi:hypothetical protein
MWHWPLTLKWIEVIYLPRLLHLWTLKVNCPWVVGILIRKHFYLQGQLIMTSDPLTPKIHWGHLLIKSNASVNIEGQGSMGCPVIDRKQFWHTRSVRLDHWPPDTKIKKGHLLAKTDASTKLRGPIAHGLSSYDWKEVLHRRSIRPWSLTSEPRYRNGSFTDQVKCIYEFWGPKVHGLSSYWSETIFYLQGQCDLDIWTLGLLGH